MLNLYIASNWVGEDLKDFPELQNHAHFAVLDIKTTGYGRDDRILEIGVVILDDNGQISQRWRTLVRPEEKLGNYPEFNVGLRELVAAPTFSDVALRLAELIDGAIIVAHNAAFEKRYLLQEFGRLGVILPAFGDWSLDTRELVEKCLGIEVSRLRDCLAAVGESYETAVDALSEADATARLLSALLRQGSCRISKKRPLQFQAPDYARLVPSRMPLSPRNDGLFPDACDESSALERGRVVTPHPVPTTHRALSDVNNTRIETSVGKPTAVDGHARLVSDWLALTGHLHNYVSGLTSEKSLAMPATVRQSLRHCMKSSESVCLRSAAEVAAVVAKHPAYAPLIDDHMVSGVPLESVAQTMFMSSLDLEAILVRLTEQLGSAGEATELVRAAIEFRGGASEVSTTTLISALPALQEAPKGLRNNLASVLLHVFWPVEKEDLQYSAVPELDPDGSHSLFVRDGSWQLLMTVTEGIVRSDMVAVPRAVADLYQLGSGQSLYLESPVGKLRINSSFGMVTLSSVKSLLTTLEVQVGDRVWLKFGDRLTCALATPLYPALGGLVGMLNAIGMDDRVRGTVAGGSIVVDSDEAYAVLNTAIGLDSEVPRRKTLQRLMHRREGNIGDLLRVH